MGAVWQVQEAKNRFSEVIDRAVHEGPQVVTRHGRPIVRVVAVTEEGADAGSEPADGFTEFLLGMPKAGGDGLPQAPRRNRRKPVKLGD